MNITDEEDIVTEDDIVIFNQRHFEWLVSAGRWPSKYLPRTARLGRVTRIEDNGLIGVGWDDGTCSLHYPDNLEVLQS